MTQQFGSLHPFSSYQRRHMALSVLHLLSTIFPFSSSHAQCDNHMSDPVDHSSPFLHKATSTDYTIRPVFEFPSAVSVNQARRLVYCIKDSYDANRVLVFDLLCHLPHKTVGLQVSYIVAEKPLGSHLVHTSPSLFCFWCVFFTSRCILYVLSLGSPVYKVSFLDLYTWIRLSQLVYIAQLVEHLSITQCVVCSNPTQCFSLKVTDCSVYMYVSLPCLLYHVD